MGEPTSAGLLQESKGPRVGGILAWAFVLGLLAVLAFGLVRTQQGPVGVGSEVPPFSLTTFEGEEIDVTALRGQVVVINFWASWCLPCEDEAAELEAAWRAHRDQGVVFLGVNYVDTRPEALAYLERFEITYPNGPDLGTRISQAFRIRGVPETYIVDANGVIAAVKIGPYSSQAEVEASIASILGR